MHKKRRLQTHIFVFHTDKQPTWSMMLQSDALSQAAVERPRNETKSAVRVWAMRPPNSKLTWNSHLTIFFTLDLAKNLLNHTKRPFIIYNNKPKEKQIIGPKATKRKTKILQQCQEESWQLLSAHLNYHHWSLYLDEKNFLCTRNFVWCQVQTSVLRKNELNRFVDPFVLSSFEPLLCLYLLGVYRVTVSPVLTVFPLIFTFISQVWLCMFGV